MAKQPSEQVKRRLKNPESFREKSLKASVANVRPSATKQIKTRLKDYAILFAKPIKNILFKLNKMQPFKFIFNFFRLVGLIIVPPYIRSSWVELKQVTWPSRLKSRQLTTAVLIFAVIFGTIVAIVDFGLDKLFRNILLK